jgi:hypothetical protein
MRVREGTKGDVGSAKSEETFVWRTGESSEFRAAAVEGKNPTGDEGLCKLFPTSD